MRRWSARVSKQRVQCVRRMCSRLLPQAKVYLASITNGVIYGVKLMTNVLVGVMCLFILLMSKETFAGQAKKIIYAILKPERGNVYYDRAQEQ